MSDLATSTTCQTNYAGIILKASDRTFQVKRKSHACILLRATLPQRAPPGYFRSFPIYCSLDSLLLVALLVVSSFKLLSRCCCLPTFSLSHCILCLNFYTIPVCVSPYYATHNLSQDFETCCKLH